MDTISLTSSLTARSSASLRPTKRPPRSRAQPATSRSSLSARRARAAQAAPGPHQPALTPETGSLREAVAAYLDVGHLRALQAADRSSSAAACST